MKFCFLLILAISSSVYSVKLLRKNLSTAGSNSDSNGHGSLYYYHKYELNHGQDINPKIPLVQHYRNERHLREKADQLKDRIVQDNHNAGFKEREIEHHIVLLKNNEDKALADKAAIDRVINCLIILGIFPKRKFNQT